MPSQKLATGIDLYYEVHGTGEPLIFIPGTGLAGNIWDETQVPELSKSLQVITLDPRGSGRSTRPETFYSIEDMAGDVICLMDHLGLPSAHICGHSMGGRIAQAMATAMPLRVSSMILAATGSGPAARAGQDCHFGLPYYLVRQLVERGFEDYVRHETLETTTYFTKDYHKKHPEKVKAFYEMCWSQHADWPSYLRLLMARQMWEGTHRLADIRVPTLVVIGDGDVVGSNHVPQAEVLAKRIPGAEYLVLEGESHGFYWQSPEKTNAWTLDWVNRHRKK
jgi:pimeloyl-ACP methyl ester carboxylesterase